MAKNAARTKAYSHLLYTRFHRIWSNMKSRCQNPNVPGYERYGGRGITVGDKWQTFDGFAEDMYDSYVQSDSNATLERINNDAGYCRENCRWASRKEQARNTRNVERAARYTHDGKTLTVREWAELSGVRRTTLGMRLREYGWTIERAIRPTLYSPMHGH